MALGNRRELAPLARGLVISLGDFGHAAIAFQCAELNSRIAGRRLEASSSVVRSKLVPMGEEKMRLIVKKAPGMTDKTFYITARIR